MGEVAFADWARYVQVLGASVGIHLLISSSKGHRDLTQSQTDTWTLERIVHPQSLALPSL